jgi:hypothetical protein
MINPLEPKYISRRDAAIILGVSVHTIIRMEKTGRIPTKVVKFYELQCIRSISGYDIKEFMAWAETNPVRHPGFRDASRRLEQRKTFKKSCYSHGGEEDVYNIQSHRKAPPFVYSGRQLMLILFLQPSLRNGRYSYSDCMD